MLDVHAGVLVLYVGLVVACNEAVDIYMQHFLLFSTPNSAAIPQITWSSFNADNRRRCDLWNRGTDRWKGRKDYLNVLRHDNRFGHIYDRGT
eukprot:scaffold16_cov147-Skeletonema_menzelii.AAC.12